MRGLRRAILEFGVNISIIRGYVFKELPDTLPCRNREAALGCGKSSSSVSDPFFRPTGVIE